MLPHYVVSAQPFHVDLAPLLEPCGWVLLGLRRGLSSAGAESWWWTLLAFGLLWKLADVCFATVALHQRIQSEKAAAGPGTLTTHLPPVFFTMGLFAWRGFVFATTWLLLSQRPALREATLVDGWLAVARPDPWLILPLLTGALLLFAQRERWFQRQPSGEGRDLPVLRLSLWMASLVSLLFVPAGLLVCLLVWGAVDLWIARSGLWKSLRARWQEPPAPEQP